MPGVQVTSGLGLFLDLNSAVVMTLNLIPTQPLYRSLWVVFIYWLLCVAYILLNMVHFVTIKTTNSHNIHIGCVRVKATYSTLSFLW